MKKKGLIISTVVMAVVLIASLTTATYAWFSTNAFAQVETINLNVGAASTVAIGLLKSGVTENSTSQADYLSGDVEISASGWTGDQNKLGATVNTGLSMTITKGVGSGTQGKYYAKQSLAELVTAGYIKVDTNGYVWDDGVATVVTSKGKLALANAAGTSFTEIDTYDATNAFDSSKTYYAKIGTDTDYSMDPAYTTGSGHVLLKASGENFTKLDKPELAIVNGYNTTTSTAGTDAEVLDFYMAINPSQANVYGTYCVITINPDANGYIGMAAALTADVTVTGDGVTTDKSKTKIDLFDLVKVADESVHFDDTDNRGDAGYKFYFIIDDYRATQMKANDATVTPFSIRLFISGYDSDCNTSATGSSATIDIQFYGMADGWTAASDANLTNAVNILA